MFPVTDDSAPVIPVSEPRRSAPTPGRLGATFSSVFPRLAPMSPNWRRYPVPPPIREASLCPRSGDMFATPRSSIATVLSPCWSMPCPPPALRKLIPAPASS